MTKDLRQRVGINLSKGFVDATFAAAKNEEPAVGGTKRDKGSQLMPVADGASLHKFTFVETTLKAGFVDEPPARLVGDRAYDNDGLDAQLATEGRIEPIAPHRSSKREPHRQDGRRLRRCKQR